jgi:hypothetical protein
MDKIWFGQVTLTTILNEMSLFMACVASAMFDSSGLFIVLETLYLLHALLYYWFWLLLALLGVRLDFLGTNRSD